MGKYDKVIEFMLNHNSIMYEDLYNTDDRLKKYSNTLQNVGFKDKFVRLLASIDEAKFKGARIRTLNQADTFEHIFINENMMKIKVRLYLSPARKNLLPLVVKIINGSLQKGQRTYFKFSIDPNRLDQLIFYCEDLDDARDKIQLLGEIKKDNPKLFRDMSQAVNWIYETVVPGVYLTPDALLKDRDSNNTSYGVLFSYALNDTKYILEYLFNIGINDSLKNVKKDGLFNSRFEIIFEEMLKRYGIYLHRDINGRLANKVNGINKFNTPISRFVYNKEEGVLKELRQLDDGTIKEWRFENNPKNKTAFMQYISRDRQYSGEEH